MSDDFFEEIAGEFRKEFGPEFSKTPACGAG